MNIHRANDCIKEPPCLRVSSLLADNNWFFWELWPHPLYNLRRIYKNTYELAPSIQIICPPPLQPSCCFFVINMVANNCNIVTSALGNFENNLSNKHKSLIQGQWRLPLIFPLGILKSVWPLLSRTVVVLLASIISWVNGSWVISVHFFSN